MTTDPRPVRRPSGGTPGAELSGRGRTGDLRYRANVEDPLTSRWPELKSRISTAGYDPGAA